MRKQRQGRPRLTPVATALGIAAVAVGLLVDSAAVGEGVRRGLDICGSVLIPSLFPFMALASFLSLTDYARILSLPLRPLTTRVLKLPGELGVIVLMSLIGGYPVGARMIASLLEQRRIDRKTAERMLCFCVNSGPSFLISAVGVGLFLSKTAGAILFATQTAATLLVGGLVSLRVPRPKSGAAQPPVASGSVALVLAVQGATSAMLAMCAFAILFSGLLSLLTASGAVASLAAALPVGEPVAAALLSGLLEVTSGCIAAAKVGGTLSFALASAAVSFGGLSVLFQIFSCFSAGAVSFRALVLSRVAHMGLSTAMAVPLYLKFCAHQTAWLALQPPLMQADGKTSLISVCLLGMCCIFTLSLGEVTRFQK